MTKSAAQQISANRPSARLLLLLQLLASTDNKVETTKTQITMQQTIDLQMPLSENFRLGEFVTSATARRLNIDNTPSPQHIVALRNLCQRVLQPLRNEFGPIRISSGYRCPRLNEAVGGVGNSQHQRGEAADIHLPSHRTGIEYYYFLRDHCPYDQLLFEHTRSGMMWIHVSCLRDLTQNRQMHIPNYKA